MRKQSTIQTIISISIVVVVVAAIMLALGTAPRNQAIEPAGSSVTQQTNFIPVDPRPDDAAIAKSKAEILALAAKPKLTPEDRNKLFGFIAGEKFNYYGFSPREQQLVLAAITRE